MKTLAHVRVRASMVIVAALLLPAARCGSSPIEGAGPSANVRVIPGSGGNWTYGMFGPSVGGITGVLLGLINGHREANGLRQLTFHDGVTVAATSHSTAMSSGNRMALVTTDGIDPYQRMVSCNPRIDFDDAFAFVGNNGVDADAIFHALLSSEAGRYVIDHPNLTHFGARTTTAAGPVQFWTVIFVVNARP